MIKSYPYLKDIDFLNKIYRLHNRTVYSNILILDWDENVLQEIQGRVTSASISINGDSSVRRTMNLSVYITGYDELYQNVDSLFTINKKVFVEFGLKNTIRHLSEQNYPGEPIIWFPFGVYVISTVSVSLDNSSGCTLSITLNDKMSLLNGEAGGTIPASTNFESYDTLGPDGSIVTQPILINRIIPELVNHFGNEALDKIIVTDIDDRIKRVMKWQGSSPLYLWQALNSIDNSFYTMSDYSADFSPLDWSNRKIIYNYDCGYTFNDFVYPGELTASAGDTVCTVLDKIKTTLGNYEYFYDIFGRFFFQEIKNYVDVSEWRTTWKRFKYPELGGDSHFPYCYNTRLNSKIYEITNDMIISCSNSPQFNMIKNDFIVWGIKKGNDNKQQFPCRYHLAIDKRPFLSEDMTNPITICFDTNVNDGIRRCFPVQEYIQKEYDENFPSNCFPVVGEVGKYYYDMTEGKIYSWIVDIGNYNLKLANMQNSAKSNTTDSTAEYSDSQDVEAIQTGYLEMPLATVYRKAGFDPSTGDPTPAEFTISKNTDWRNILYFQDMFAAAQGLQTSYYWAEMYNEWPKIYDIEKDEWLPGVLDSPSSLDWWLDLIDNDSSVNKFSVDNIGRRSYAKTESGCNCVFEPDIPDIIMVNTGDSEEIIDSRNAISAHEMKELGLVPIQVSKAIFDSITTGGSYNSCYQNVRQLLTNYTDYNESITITCLPIYHLEPNTRIKLNLPDAGIMGEYIVNTISFDLSNSNTMNINAKKVVEKI